MLNSMLELPPIIIIAYISLLILVIGFLLVFMRYAYISFFYKNKSYYLGYKSGILGLRNFGQAVKDEILTRDGKIDIKEKISLIKSKLRDLVISNEVHTIENNIKLLQNIIDEIKDVKKNEFLKLEEDTFDNIQNQLQSLLGSTNIKELKKIIEDISESITDLKLGIGTIDIGTIYANIADQLSLYTDEFDERKNKIIQDIKELELKLPNIEKNLGLLQDKKIEIENDNIKSLMKENKNGENLVQSIKSDFKNLGHGIGIIIVSVLLISLLAGDILLMYKLIYDLSAQQIRAGEYFIEGFISYELFGIVVSLFLPMVLLVLMEIAIRKSKAGKILGHIFKYGLIFLSLLSFLVGFGYFIWTRIVGGDTGSIEQIMPFFLLPATLALAYGFDAIATSKNGFSPISAPLAILPKSLIYTTYIIWKRWQVGVKQKSQKKAIEKQISDIKEERLTITNSITHNEGIIESIRTERDKKILSEVKEVINIEGNITKIDISLNEVSKVEVNIGAGISFIKSAIKTFTDTFNRIKQSRKSELIRTEKKLLILRKNIEDMEQGFEYAMKEKLTIN